MQNKKVARRPSVWKHSAALSFWLGSTVLAIAAATRFTAACYPSFSSLDVQERTPIAILARSSQRQVYQ